MKKNVIAINLKKYEVNSQLTGNNILNNLEVGRKLKYHGYNGFQREANWIIEEISGKRITIRQLTISGDYKTYNISFLKKLITEKKIKLMKSKVGKPICLSEEQECLIRELNILTESGIESLRKMLNFGSKREDFELLKTFRKCFISGDKFEELMKIIYPKKKRDKPNISAGVQSNDYIDNITKPIEIQSQANKELNDEFAINNLDKEEPEKQKNQLKKSLIQNKRELQSEIESKSKIQYIENLLLNCKNRHYTTEQLIEKFGGKKKNETFVQAEKKLRELVPDLDEKDVAIIALGSHLSKSRIDKRAYDFRIYISIRRIKDNEEGGISINNRSIRIPIKGGG